VADVGCVILWESSGWLMSVEKQTNGVGKVRCSRRHEDVTVSTRRTARRILGDVYLETFAMPEIIVTDKARPSNNVYRTGTPGETAPPLPDHNSDPNRNVICGYLSRKAIVRKCVAESYSGRTNIYRVAVVDGACLLQLRHQATVGTD